MSSAAVVIGALRVKLENRSKTAVAYNVSCLGAIDRPKCKVKAMGVFFRKQVCHFHFAQSFQQVSILEGPELF